jgi:hypothetical protein
MPAPVYSAGTPGNVINGVSVAKGANVAAFLDLSTVIEGQVNCEVVTGTVPTAGTVFSAYKAYAAGAAAPITLSSAVAAGATSLSVASMIGLSVGQNIALWHGSAPTVGEIVTVTAITGTGPYTLTITGNGTGGGSIYSYSSGDGVYLIGQTAAFSVMPSGPTGTWAANKDYSAPMFLGTGQWIIAANNTDAAQTVMVNATCDRITSVQ